MTVEDVVRRYEFTRPELRLVGYEEVGLPFYRVKIRAFTLEHKPIAAIEEFSNYPQTDYRLDAEEIDLPVREGFAQHVLVGLNIFLIEMAQQFPEVLGIRSEDPGLGGTNLSPLQVTENAILDQAANATARLSIEPVWNARSRVLDARVSVDNLAGHKLPSGVGFRRASSRPAPCMTRPPGTNLKSNRIPKNSSNQYS